MKKIHKVLECVLFVIIVVCILGNYIYLNAEEQNTIIKLNGGLEAQVDCVGRNENGEAVNISISLSNAGHNTFYIALEGPTSAQDNAGGRYELKDVSGVYNTEQWYFRDNKEKQVWKLQQFTPVEPGIKVTINFHLKGNKSKGPVMSFSTLLAVRIVTDPAKDMTITEEQKVKQVRTMNLSFPSFTVTEKK